MDEQKEKMTELRNILDEIEENRAKGLEKGCSVSELDFYLETIIEEEKNRKMAISYANRR